MYLWIEDDGWMHGIRNYYNSTLIRSLDAAIWVKNKNQDPWSYEFHLHPMEIPDKFMIQIKSGFLKFDKVRCLLQYVN
jgi:hypothetical protein